MAYDARNLSVLAYANGFTLWHYTTNDGSVLTTGYFDAAADLLRKGDLIIASVAMSGTTNAQTAVVRSVTSSSVLLASSV